MFFLYSDLEAIEGKGRKVCIWMHVMFSIQIMRVGVMGFL